MERDRAGFAIVGLGEGSEKAAKLGSELEPSRLRIVIAN